MDALNFVFGLVVVIGVIILTRFLGSWMLRINDVIEELKKLNDKIDKMNGSNNS